MKTLAIDQGTTSTRGMIVEGGRVTPLFSHRHAQIYPAPGHVEHDPEELLAAVRTCIDRAVALGDVECVGLANQGESCLAWDARTGRAISPVIVWQDDRTRAECEALRAHGVEALTLARAGLPLDPYFSASKLGWIMRNVPEAGLLAAEGRLRLGTTDAFFRDSLTGHHATDLATASRTSLLDLDRLCWDADLCAAFGVPIGALPQIGPTSGDLGRLPGGLALTSAIVDQQAALYGHGCRQPGDVKVTFGTGAFVLAVTGGRIDAPGLLPTIAWTGQDGLPVYAIEGGVYSAAAALDWARGIGLFNGLDELDALPDAPSAARDLFFVPALAGLGAPHWDRSARGTWMGIGLDTTRPQLLRAVIEGVAFLTAEVLSAMAQTIPLRGPVSVDGGMSRSTVLCHSLADASGLHLRISDETELTVIGLAALAAGTSAADPEIGGREIAPEPIPADWLARFGLARELVVQFGEGAPL